MEAICLKIEGCWEVVTSGKGGRGCGSPGGGKGGCVEGEWWVGGLPVWKGSLLVRACCVGLKQHNCSQSGTVAEFDHEIG